MCATLCCESTVNWSSLSFGGLSGDSIKQWMDFWKMAGLQQSVMIWMMWRWWLMSLPPPNVASLVQNSSSVLLEEGSCVPKHPCSCRLDPLSKIFFLFTILFSECFICILHAVLFNFRMTIQCRMCLQPCWYNFCGSIGQSGLIVSLMLMLLLLSTIPPIVTLLVTINCPSLWPNPVSKKRSLPSHSFPLSLHWFIYFEICSIFLLFLLWNFCTSLQNLNLVIGHGKSNLGA